MTGRRALGAHVSGPAAVWLLRYVGEANVRRSIANFRANGRPDVARDLEAAYLDLREAARQWLAARDDDGTSTELGTSVVPGPEPEAPLNVAMDCPGAAAALGVSERRVRQLVAGGLLAGRKVGGTWLIDRDDVARAAADRRTSA